MRLDERAIAGSLVTLLSLTSDAVIVFDGEGVVLLANEEACRLFDAGERGLVDMDVRMLFSPVVHAESKGIADALPFSLDGSTAHVTRGHGADRLPLSVRCERLRMQMESYLLVAFASDPRDAAEQEHARLVDELSRANRRLSGTLGIVLETLDALDVGTLFDRVLREITETMGAWGTLAYVAEPDGYRLRGSSEELHDVPIPAFLATGHPLVQLMERSGGSLRLRVRRPTTEELRRGALAEREVIEEMTLASTMVPVGELAPFPSSVFTPVWFGGHVIAVFQVGWRHEHGLRNDDIRLLDAVADYMSVQLAGAFAAMRAQHAERLESLGTSLREELLTAGAMGQNTVDDVFATAADALGCEYVAMRGNPHQRTTMANLPRLGLHYVPVDLAALARGNDAPVVLDVADEPGLAEWLLSHGEPSRGTLMLLGSRDDVLQGALFLRGEDEAPFEEVDLAFLRRLAEDLVTLAQGEEARGRDKRIAQALQRGMRNQLQRVDGISAQSCFSSATEAALVGGDLYDLIRLPDRKACVVMGDVSGKGVEAASVSSAVKTALGAYAWEGLRPARMVSLLNDFLLGFSRIETFATMFVGLVDLGTGRLTYCSAGHPPALIVRARNGELVTLEVQSGVVGAFESMAYRDGEVAVHEGDVLLLYTDGITEARSPSGAFFGEDGLREVVSREVPNGFEGLCDRMQAEVAAFGGGRLEDDVAILALRFEAIGE